VFVQLDIKDSAEMEKQVFQKYNITSCIHFAAFKAVGESVAKPLEYYHNNVCGSVTLLQLLQKYSVSTFIFSSSACVYGENPNCIEGDTIQPINPYG
jgi:UDP-glucose 4-epimerase